MYPENLRFMLELFFIERGLKIAQLMAMIYISMQPTPSLEKVLLPRYIYISPGTVQKRYFEPFFSIHVIHVSTNLGVG